MGRGGYAAAAHAAHRGGPARDSPVRGVVRWHADVVVVVKAVRAAPPPPSRWRRLPTRPHCQHSSGDPQRISSMAAAHAARRMTPTAIAAVATCNPRPHRHHGGGDQCGAPLPIQQWGPLRLDVIMSRTLLVARSPSPQVLFCRISPSSSCRTRLTCPHRQRGGGDLILAASASTAEAVRSTRRPSQPRPVPRAALPPLPSQ